MTCVAPREVSREALCGEAVVMMGANPASFAIWIASRAPNELVNYNRQLRWKLERETYVDVPYCPTDDEPPMMNAGFPAKALLPDSSQKGGKRRLLSVLGS